MTNIAQCIDFVAISINNNTPPPDCGLITVGFLMGLIIGLIATYVFWKLTTMLPDKAAEKATEGKQ